MEASKAVAPYSQTNNNTNKSVDEFVVNIEKMNMEALPNSDSSFRIYRVPNSLSCGKPEAFIPQFVGLGPLHHFRPELVPKDKLKVDSATTVLKKDRSRNIEFGKLVDEIGNSNPDLVGFVRSCYDFRIELTDLSLLYMMTLDALFLYGLLHSWASMKGILRNAVVGGVFMLENQIPTRVLTEIVKVAINNSAHNNQVQEESDDPSTLSSMMLKLCLQHCPLLVTRKLSNTDEAHVADSQHLLDLMYYLIGPEPESKPEPEDKPKPEDKDKETESKHESESKSTSEDKDKDEDKAKPNSRRMNACMTCCCIIIVLYLIWWLVWEILKAIFKVIYKVLAKLLHLVAPAIKLLHGFLSKNDSGSMIVKLLKVILDWNVDLLEQEVESGRPTIVIPSVTEFHKAGITLKPAENGLSSIHFDVKTYTLYLPAIKLEVSSDAIIGNLVAYELMIKSEGLLFTGFVYLMKAIVTTDEDVQLLKKQGIIETELSHQKVKELFNGIKESNVPTKTPGLDKCIDKAILQYDSFKAPSASKLDFGYLFRIFLTIVAAIALAVITIYPWYCTIFGCSTGPKFGKLPPHGVDGTNNYLISSM